MVKLCAIYRVCFVTTSNCQSNLETLVEVTKVSKNLSQSNLTWTPTKTKDPGVSSKTNQKDLDTSREYEQPTVQLEKAQPHIQQAESRGEEAKQIGPENHSTEVWNVSLSWKITPIFFPSMEKN